jgi:1-acyl-sn-glycerol-3-phosphate acyltransferase
MDARDDGGRRRRGGAPGGSALLAGARLVCFVVLTVLFIPVVLAAAIGDRDGRRAYRIARWWGWLNVRTCGVDVDVDGLAHLDPGASYVFMANHRSAFDVLTLVVVLWDFQLRWVAKAELARIPGFGACLRATKQIFVERGNHAAAVASLAAARERVRGGISAVFFPEGTRGDGGPMLPFKKGGFVFAIETGTPIVPIAIVGSGDLLAHGSLLGRWGSRLRVVVRPPIATAGRTVAERDVLSRRVRAGIAGIVDAPPPPARQAAAVAAAGLAACSRTRP